MNRVDLATARLVHLDILYNMASWLVQESADAQALVRETYRRVHHTVPQQLSGAHVRVRLLTMMWDIHRERQQPNSDPPQTPPFEEGRMGGEKADIDAGLRRLPEDLRVALILVDREGCPLPEVAEILGSSREQVQSALSRGRRILRSFLGTDLSFPQPPSETEEQS